jgi:hypothetical protein
VAPTVVCVFVCRYNLFFDPLPSNGHAHCCSDTTVLDSIHQTNIKIVHKYNEMNHTVYSLCHISHVVIYIPDVHKVIRNEALNSDK